MSGFYTVSPDLAKKLASPFFEPPDDAVAVKGGSRWTEDLVIENITFLVDQDDPTHETLRVQFRVPADSGSNNSGRSTTESFNFYWNAVQTGSPENRVMQTTIAYREFNSLMAALGEAGYKSPGEVKAIDYKGMRIRASITVADDKDGVKRQRTNQFTAAH